ncbi:hypothetical protein B0H11DRAFT_1938205 [Mycena galericulata]|nr:hypothetical protein B0H11DRAFT_1938205 [Mycena galericulata]
MYPKKIRFIRRMLVPSQMDQAQFSGQVADLWGLVQTHSADHDRVKHIQFNNGEIAPKFISFRAAEVEAETTAFGSRFGAAETEYFHPTETAPKTSGFRSSLPMLEIFCFSGTETVAEDKRFGNNTGAAETITFRSRTVGPGRHGRPDSARPLKLIVSVAPKQSWNLLSSATVSVPLKQKISSMGKLLLKPLVLGAVSVE